MYVLPCLAVSSGGTLTTVGVCGGLGKPRLPSSAGRSMVAPLLSGWCKRHVALLHQFLNLRGGWLLVSIGVYDVVGVYCCTF